LSHALTPPHHRSHLITTGADSVVKVWELSTGKVLHTLEGADLSRGGGTAVPTHNEEFVVAGDGTGIMAWSAATGGVASRWDTDHAEVITAVACDPTRLRIATGDQGGGIRFFTPRDAGGGGGK
jgi:cleavage stimulation factor subunit 1